jgi:tripartite-type tricarboxylate transporter receptor subunit TctC
VVTLLNRTINDILKQPDAKDKLLAQGFVEAASTVDEMALRMKAEAALWGTVIKNANITVQ